MEVKYNYQSQTAGGSSTKKNSNADQSKYFKQGIGAAAAQSHANEDYEDYEEEDEEDEDGHDDGQGFEDSLNQRDENFNYNNDDDYTYWLSQKVG